MLKERGSCEFDAHKTRRLWLRLGACLQLVGKPDGRELLCGSRLVCFWWHEAKGLTYLDKSVVLKHLKRRL